MRSAQKEVSSSELHRLEIEANHETETVGKARLWLRIAVIKLRRRALLHWNSADRDLVIACRDGKSLEDRPGAIDVRDAEKLLHAAIRAQKPMLDAKDLQKESESAVR